ncbi:MAG TPA: TIGR03435 family protein [Candidatus Limnocylindrales bacterium]|nr:TIGR03435 family protein [Candidatus Limnocylindrales bacterium]
MFRAIAGFVFVCGLAAAQTPEFEVVSLKPSPPATSPIGSLFRFNGGPGTADPTNIHYRNIPVAMLITDAYEVTSADVVGPDWARVVEMRADRDKYDIDAKLPPGTTKEQLRLMMRKLLEDRFGIQVHREKKEVPAYALTAAKGGPKIQPAPDVPPDVPEAKVDVSVRGEDGFPKTPPAYSGLFVTVTPGHTRVKIIRFSMEQFAKWTRANSRRPGVDRTGMPGVYSFYLEFGNEIGARPTDAGDADRGPEFAVAVEKQLGLKLVSDKTEIEQLIIDHIERVPSGN